MWGQEFNQEKLQKGIDLYAKGAFDASILVLTECISTAEDTNDNIALQSIYTNLGNAHASKGNVIAALENYQKGLDIAYKTADTLRATRIINNIATLYSDAKDFERALEYFQQAMRWADWVNDEETLADCANGIALIREQQENYPEALNLYNQALKIYEKHNIEDRLALVYNNLGIIHKQLNQLDQTIYYYNKALEIATKIDANYIVAALSANMANVYLLQKKYPEAIQANHSAMEKARQIGATAIVIETYGNLMDVYEAMNNYKEAFRYAKRYKQANDSLFTTENAAQLAEMKEKYETEKKEAENLSLKEKNRIKTLLLNEKSLQLKNRNLLLLGSLLVLLLTGIVIRLYWSRQKAKNHTMRILAVKETEKQERLRIAKDLHDDLGAGITKINLIGNLISEHATKDEKTLNYGITIKETTKQIAESIKTLVWSLNTQHLNLGEFIPYIRQYSYDFFEELPLKINFKSEIRNSSKEMSSLVFRQLFMTIKECLNNIAKHAEASEVTLLFTEIDNGLCIQIKDNGKGIRKQAIKGNGLQNIQNRIKSIQGKIEIQSHPGQGVQIDIEVYWN